MLIKISAGIYLLSLASFIVYLVRQNKVAATGGNYLIATGFGLQTIGLLGEAVSRGQLPVLNMVEAFNFFGWTIAGVYLLINYKFRLPIIGALAAPLAAGLTLVGSGASGAATYSSPVFQSLWLTMHLATVFGGYGFFSLAFLGAIVYLLQERQIKSRKTGRIFKRLPSLNALDQLNYYCLTLGFPLMTLGIITGAAYAQFTLGTYWRWDPKEVWSLVLWLVYATLLHQRLTVGWRGRRAAIMAIIGFSVLCFTFIGVSWLLPGYHSFESLKRLQVQ